MQLLTASYSQHYNKKLRTLSPATERAGGDPATPVRSTTKRKKPARKTADPSASPTPGAESGAGKKKATSKAASDEAVEDGDEGSEESPSKKLKAGESEDQE
jgi:hypothetical protein